MGEALCQSVENPLATADPSRVLQRLSGARASTAFERHEVSIRSLEQEGVGADARLIFITHQAREADVQATLEDLRELDVIHRITSVLRVIGDDQEA